MEGGYFTDLVNERNNPSYWDGMSSQVVEDGMSSQLGDDGVGSEPVDDGMGSQPVAQQFPIVERTPLARPNQKRSKNFSIQEDEVLVSAWLYVSLDPLLGTNQTRDAYWKRIYDHFNKTKKSTSDRSQNSIMHCWKSIQENVNKFCGCVSQIEGRRKSGVTIPDKAIALFKSLEDKRFQFLHCWTLLWSQAKWHEKMKQLSSQKTLCH